MGKEENVQENPSLGNNPKSKMAFSMIGGSEPSMMTESQLFYVPPTITERQATHDVLLGPSAATFDEANDITFDVAPCADLISLADIRLFAILLFKMLTVQNFLLPVLCAHVIISLARFFKMFKLHLPVVLLVTHPIFILLGHI